MLADEVFNFVDRLTDRDVAFAILASALITHVVFNRWEPFNIAVVSALLLGLPAVLSTLLSAHYGVLVGIPCTFMAFYACLLTSIVVYRVSPLHPLARYPGPFLAKISKFWMVRNIRRGATGSYIQNLHDQYGDVVRTGPNEISIRDVSAIAPVMGSQGLPKGPAWDGRGMHPEVHALVGLRDPEEHAKRRRPWNRAFSTGALKEYLPMIRKRGTQFIECLRKLDGQPSVDLNRWIRYYSYDFMGEMAFGGGTEMLRDGDTMGILTLMQEGLGLVPFIAEMPWLGYYVKKVPGIGSRWKGFRQMAMTRTAERYKNGSMAKDIFYYLSNEDGAEKISPPPRIVISDGVLAVVAGSDTTAGILARVVYCLLRYPQVYKTLQAEVDKYYPPGEDALDPKCHKDMPYLDAVLNETLRLFPVLGAGSERAPCVGKGDKMVGPYFIPEGTQVKVHTYSVQRDPRWWTNGENYWPERWLIAEGLLPPPAFTKSAGEFKHTPNAFIPFSFGPANCVGKNLAMMNMRIILCLMLQNIQIGLPVGVERDKWVREMDHQFLVIGKAKFLPVSLKVRA